MREEHLYEQIAQYLNVKYPSVPYHFDLSGLWTPSHKARNLYGRLNSHKAWPDLFIAGTRFYDGAYHGLFIELKREGTKLKKRDGTYVNDHVAAQAAMLSLLQDQGYIAQFAVGFDEAKEIIDSYMEPA